MLNIKCLKKISLERHEIIFLFTLPTSLSSVRFTVSHGYVVFSKLKPKPSPNKPYSVLVSYADAAGKQRSQTFLSPSQNATWADIPNHFHPESYWVEAIHLNNHFEAFSH